MIFLSACLWGLIKQATASEASTPQEPTPHFIYFILVDRFYNGDQNNDQTIDPTDLQAFHGGDLSGIEAKLDYIQGLGADSLWLSPIFSMRTEKFHGHGAFHGYWVQHLDSIESRFGGEKALLSLSNSMQTQNMNLLLDMVYNHVSFDSPMIDAHPDWFHSYPSIEDWNNPFQLTHYQVHGLPDLDQTRPPVYQYLLHRSLYWEKTAQVRGFRIDAIRHMENDFLKQLSQDSNAWMLGEDFNGNPADLITRGEQTGLDALFDFPLYYALTQDLCDENQVSQIASIISMDQYYPDNFQLVRFLDNHDLPRIYSRCNENKEKVYQALSFIFSVQGIPMVSYGTETWSKGDSEPENRASFDWNSIDPNLEAAIKTLAQFRKTHPVLQKGKPRITHYTTDQLIIEQSWNGHLSYTILNLSSQKIDFSPPKNTKYIAGIEQMGEGIVSKQSLEFLPNTISTLIYEGSSGFPSEEKITINLNTKEEGLFLLVGSSPQFGSWNPDKGIPLQKNGHFYSTELSLTQNQVISYKIVKKEDDTYIWENGVNHFLWTDVKNSANLTIKRNDEE